MDTALRYEAAASRQAPFAELPPTNRNRLLVEWIGRNNRVLEMGCSTGFLSKVLRDNGCSVVGIEYDPEMAKAAEQFCERVYCADLNKSEWAKWVGTGFDVISFGDVLEHLIDPGQTLSLCRNLLAPNGRIIVSLPNVAFLSNRIRLLLGKWDYSETGLLDRTHLRFFTLKSAQTLFIESGFTTMRYLPITGVKGASRFPRLCQWVANRVPGLLGFQFLFELR